MTYLVTQLSTNDQQELIQAFKRFDKNSNGTISKEEMFEGYKELYSERNLTD
jgi:Ca2+-binding EF-hand superfamily protein